MDTERVGEVKRFPESTSDLVIEPRGNGDDVTEITRVTLVIF